MNPISNELSKAVRLALTVGAASVAVVPAVYAQDDAETLETITVVGSRIKRTDIETSQPVFVIERADLQRTGLTSVGDILQELTSNGATLNPQLKYQWQSEKYDAGLYRPQAYYPNNRNTRETAIPAFGLLDVSLRFAPAGDRWDVPAYVNNATDELNIKSLTYDPNPAGATLGQTLATLGEPRTYGVILTAKF